MLVLPQGVVLTGGGSDIGGAADSFVFAFRKMKGDGEIVARPRVGPAGRRPIHRRPHGPGRRGRSGRRERLLRPAGRSHHGRPGGPPDGGRGSRRWPCPPDPQVRNQFLRLRREGRRFTLARSSDRIAWVKMGSVDIDMPDEVAIGLAVSARKPAMTTVGEFDFVRLLAADAAAPREAWELEPLGLAGPLASAVARGGQADHGGGGRRLHHDLGERGRLAGARARPTPAT